MKYISQNDATPIDADEAQALIPPHIQTQEALNEWEQTNILKAHEWLFAKKELPLLELSFCMQLHHKMFDKTWHWAGKFRRTNKNIGCFWDQVPVQLQTLLDDVNYQVAHNTYDIDEIAARFHHRLVWIHPFPNGNGRHARLMTDLLLIQNKMPKFTWGGGGGGTSLQEQNRYRKEYIKSLQLADRGEYECLFEFVRS